MSESENRKALVMLMTFLNVILFCSNQIYLVIIHAERKSINIKLKLSEGKTLDGIKLLNEIRVAISLCKNSWNFWRGVLVNFKHAELLSFRLFLKFLISLVSR